MTCAEKALFLHMIMKEQNYDFDNVVDRRLTDATKIEELEEKYGRCDLLPLWIADMDFATPKPVLDAMRDRLADGSVLGYTTAPASFWNSITGWLRRRHGWEVDRTEIDYIPGVKKGLGLCVNFFTRPGDRVVIQPPVYHSFRSVVEGNGRVPVENPLILGDDGNYTMDFDGLELLMLEQRPSMMIVCNPHNPVGLQWDAATLARVAEICRDNGVVLLSDEIYADLTFSGVRHIPTATVSDAAAEVTVTLGAPSKSFNIPGLASAWTVVRSPRLREPFFAWLESSEFDTPPLMAVAATEAAYSRCAGWLENALSYIEANADFAIDFISREMPRVKALRPQAGFGLWIDFRDLGLDDAALTSMLVDRAMIAVSDGPSFGTGGNGFVRLNIACARPVLADALSRVAKAVGGC